MHNTNLDIGPKEFLAYAKPPIINIFNSNRNIKTILYLHVLMTQGEREVEFAFHSKGLKLILERTDESDIYNEMVEEILEEIDMTREAEGSGWRFGKSYKISITYHKMGPNKCR